jgi:hypothetical protein
LSHWEKLFSWTKNATAILKMFSLLLLSCTSWFIGWHIGADTDLWRADRHMVRAMPVKVSGHVMGKNCPVGMGIFSHSPPYSLPLLLSPGPQVLVCWLVLCREAFAHLPSQSL